MWRDKVICFFFERIVCVVIADTLFTQPDAILLGYPLSLGMKSDIRLNDLVHYDQVDSSLVALFCLMSHLQE